MADPLDPETGYSFLAEAAAAARADSRRYWANNDKRHPVAEDIGQMWPLGVDLPNVEPPRPKTRRGM